MDKRQRMVADAVTVVWTQHGTVMALAFYDRVSVNKMYAMVWLLEQVDKGKISKATMKVIASMLEGWTEGSE